MMKDRALLLLLLAVGGAAAAGEWCSLPQYDIDLGGLPTRTFENFENFNGFRTNYLWTTNFCQTLPANESCAAGYFVQGKYVPDNGRCYEQIGQESPTPTVKYNGTAVTITYQSPGTTASAKQEQLQLGSHRPEGATDGASPKFAVVEITCDSSVPAYTYEPVGDIVYRSTSNPYTQYYYMYFRSACACPGHCKNIPTDWCAQPGQGIFLRGLADQTFEIDEVFGDQKNPYLWTLNLCKPLPARGPCPAGYFVLGEYPQGGGQCYQALGDPTAALPDAVVDETAQVVTLSYLRNDPYPKRAIVNVKCDETLPEDRIEPAGDVVANRTANPIAGTFTFNFRSRCACRDGCHKPTWCRIPQSGIDLSAWLPAYLQFNLTEEDQASTARQNNTAAAAATYQWGIGLCYPLPALGDCGAGPFFVATDPAGDGQGCYRQLGGAARTPTSAFDGAKEEVTITYPNPSDSSSVVARIRCDPTTSPALVPTANVTRTRSEGGDVFTFQFKSLCACRGGCV